MGGRERSNRGRRSDKRVLPPPDNWWDQKLIHLSRSILQIRLSFSQYHLTFGLVDRQSKGFGVSNHSLSEDWRVSSAAKRQKEISHPF